MPYSPNFKTSKPLHNTPECNAKFHQSKCKAAKDAGILLTASVVLAPFTGGATLFTLPFVAVNCFNQCLEALSSKPSTPL